MHRLIAIIATFNLMLSGVVVYKVISYSTEAKNYSANPNPIVSIPTPPQLDPVDTTEDDLDENGELLEKDTDTGKTLTTQELEIINSGRNPFTTSPVVDAAFEAQETSYQEKMTEIQKKIEELEKQKEQEEADSLVSEEDDFNTSETPVDTTTDNTDTDVITGNTGADPVKTRLDKAEAVTIAKEKAQKYQIPTEWIIAMIEETSGYQSDLVTTKDGVERKGIMQIRDDRLKFIMESLGRYYQPSLVTNPTMGIEMGAWYMSYLSKINSDNHHVFTAYYHGETYAKDLKAKQGSYQTTFSDDILRKVNNTKLD